jgi:hypothetical protein
LTGICGTDAHPLIDTTLAGAASNAKTWPSSAIEVSTDGATAAPHAGKAVAFSACLLVGLSPCSGC